MLYALRGGLLLAVTIIVFKFFLPEVGVRLVELITRVIDLVLSALDHIPTNF
ncbi:MAG: hypothetical protein ABIE68_04810 [bacterium]